MHSEALQSWIYFGVAMISCPEGQKSWMGAGSVCRCPKVQISLMHVLIGFDGMYASDRTSVWTDIG